MGSHQPTSFLGYMDDLLFSCLNDDHSILCFVMIGCSDVPDVPNDINSTIASRLNDHKSLFNFQLKIVNPALYRLVHWFGRIEPYFCIA